MHEIEAVARGTILRALAFTAFGIGTVMIGFSFDPALCFLTGACLTLMTAAVLMLKGRLAPRANVRRTEAWMLLGGNVGMTEDRAQAVMGPMFQSLYYRYARGALLIGAFFWGLSVVFRLG